jgi:hypothetical protein
MYYAYSQEASKKSKAFPRVKNRKKPGGTSQHRLINPAAAIRKTTTEGKEN